MRERKERVHGPYEERAGWRVVIIGAGGGRVAKTFATEREALDLVERLRGKIDARTIQTATDAYLQHLRHRKLRSSTVTRQDYHLRLMLHLSANGPRKIRWLKPARAVELYDRAQVVAAVDTHRNALATAKAFGRWCAKVGWLPADPFAGIEGIGRRKKGKAQPRVDEARALFDYLLEAGAAGDESAVALATVLALGTRSSEVVERDVRDLDDGGRLLWIPDSKTDSGRRTVEIPEAIRPLLLALAKDRLPMAPLFRKRDGDRADRHWLYHHAARLVDDAKLVVKVPPQALRGLHGTLARIDGASVEAVMRQLGHSSAAMTEGGAYVDRGTVAEVERKKTFDLIQGGRR
jgi:integrase